MLIVKGKSVKGKTLNSRKTSDLPSTKLPKGRLKDNPFNLETFKDKALNLKLTNR
jgi:hypothetical protein